MSQHSRPPHQATFAGPPGASRTGTDRLAAPAPAPAPAATPNRDVPPEPATMFLMVGLPGAGKTTRAEELAAAHRALRLTPDEWMIPLFDGSQPAGKRDLLEGRLIALALQALRLGVDVVLDFGLWSRDERSALRWLAASAGAASHVVYLPVDRDAQLARITHRWATAPHTTFPMSVADIDTWRGQFQAPDAAELGGDVPGPPPGWRGWWEWAVDRWPSLAHGRAVEGRGRDRPAGG
ncbi:AAA family ATPase [Micromonospora haikouensis]|uniref:AAA family ATPase n=1 Tax=Micromonospora haikouensis TaxID=686309 RepID=UPI003D71AF57